ncbi:MAG TPA: biopolymer transporter ExbD [Piscirickettsiaceae bacterium]|nr:biopolymer transporter ExbD [Piscirickettsiaceae bacterium]HIQ40417.1 biopolymer transporter ExbD [Sulfurivirga caldicuralii]
MQKFDQINVVPLIDVMLVLLTVIMVTASFITLDKLNLELPQTQQTTNTPDQPDALELALDAQGQLYLEGKRASLDLLSAHLRQQSRPITLKVDRRCAFEHFVQVIERIKSLTPPPKLTILTEHVQR